MKCQEKEQRALPSHLSDLHLINKYFIDTIPLSNHFDEGLNFTGRLSGNVFGFPKLTPEEINTFLNSMDSDGIPLQMINVTLPQLGAIAAIKKKLRIIRKLLGSEQFS